MTAPTTLSTNDISLPRKGTRSRSQRARTSHALGLTLALPAVALLLLFIIWPIVTAGVYSTTSASGFGDMDPVGAANFLRALQDPDLYAAFARNVVFAAIVLAFSIVVGFSLAYFLFLRVAGWRVLQLLFMVPYIMPVVVTALLWQFILEPENGLLNSALRAVGLDALAGPWLTGESTALGSVSLVQAWVTIPFAMLLIFGAMITLPADVLEAAELDGAGHFTKMFRIVLPMVRPTVVLTAIVITIQLFRSFDLVYLLTRGGPISSTTIATLFIFVQGFVNNEYGYANAVGILVGVVLVLIAVIPQFISRRLARRSGRQGTQQ
ncbi:carbohydrate ABC transporter permease [Leifsonia sp. NPDC014704]|uniref:carbohydrate ABC transporter permease n=1 Tax=Leifsonia sp. NPDC014704 TaxID=3364123 RepID=UPI0036F4B010